ncbi:MAG: hypothetical protein GX100_04695, partial [candidate division WS1 bacterium]|nr:hypothetical protein [candidate division WS1 bacterium]
MLMMMAVVLVGVLFVALVSYNQEQSTRDSDVIRATALAEAGLRYADEMLTNSPQGADWRPPFRPFDPATYDVNDPATWPVPPVWFTDGTCTPNALGPDGIQFTDDDYYTDEEVRHGWAALVNLTPPGPPGPSAPYYERYGFARYPDPTNAGQRGDPANQGPLYGAGGMEGVDLTQGHFLLRLTYSPSPPFKAAEVANNGNNLSRLTPDPLSKYLKIEAVGVSAGTTFVWRSLVGYKALGITDHILWVTDKQNTGQPAILGFGPWMDMENKEDGRLIPASVTEPVDRVSPDFLVTHFEGPMRFNSSVDLRGDNADNPPTAGSLKDERLGGTQIDLLTQPVEFSDDTAWRPRGGGYLRDDRFESQHMIQESSEAQDSASPPSTILAQSTTVNLRTTWGISTSHTLWDSGLTTEPTAMPHFSTYGGRVLDNVQGFDSDGHARHVDPLAPPDLFQTDPATGISRYYALTRDSGPVARNSTTGLTAKVGRYGHGPGIYVDNFSDLQFVNSDGTHDLQALLDDFLGNLAATDPRAVDSGWNAVRSMYAAKGVQITLYRSELDLLEQEGRVAADIVTAHNPGTLLPNQIWWPGHVSGEPGIKLERRDQRWRIADPTNLDAPDLGDDSGTNVMFVDYPQPGNQVLLAEGNIRIHGQLPPDTSGTGRYNLTVVSGGTIYVDGQILCPQDVAFTFDEIDELGLPLPRDGEPHGGRFTGAKPSDQEGLPDEMNSYVALLARDHVVVNPTQLLPQLTQGLVTAQPDDSTAPLTSPKHWELSPVLGGSIYTRWTYGEPPVTTVGAGPVQNLINLVAYQTAADPGPAGISLAVNSASANYDFDPGGPEPRYRFLFVPSGLYSPPLPAWITQSLSPNWAPLFSTGGPVVPWPLNGATNYLTARPGAQNWLQFAYANPGVGSGATNYWLKSFKLEELDPDAVNTYEESPYQNRPLPKGILHAKINAVMYAQEGCFFVIPPQYFDPGARPDPTTGDPYPSARFRRYNYDLEVRGAIAENFHAPPAAWQQWQERCAYPNYW